MTTVRVLHFDGSQLALITQPEPTITDDEVLIRPLLMGICSTDLELLRGYKNFRGVLGHEFVGEVVAGDAAWLGKRVVGEINIACGACDMCQRGIPTHCRKRSVLGILGNYAGAFADVFRLPIANLHEVPTVLTNEEAVFTEPTAAACEILEQVPITRDLAVAVVGVGRLGMLVVQMLHDQGAQVTGIVRHQRQADLLASWGIAHSRIEDAPRHMADVVVDCTGNASGFATALELVRPRGTLVLKSSYEGLPQADLTQVVVNEITVVGSRCGPFVPAFYQLAHKSIKTAPLIDHLYSLQNYEKALNHAQQKGIFKILLQP